MKKADNLKERICAVVLTLVMILTSILPDVSLVVQAAGGCIQQFAVSGDSLYDIVNVEIKQGDQDVTESGLNQGTSGDSKHQSFQFDGTEGTEYTYTITSKSYKEPITGNFTASGSAKIIAVRFDDISGQVVNKVNVTGCVTVQNKNVQTNVLAVYKDGQGSVEDFAVNNGVYSFSAVCCSVVTLTTGKYAGYQSKTQEITVQDKEGTQTIAPIELTPQMYTIKTEAASGGSITPVNPSVQEGVGEDFTIVPAKGYKIKSYTVNGTKSEPETYEVAVAGITTNVISAEGAAVSAEFDSAIVVDFAFDKDESTTGWSKSIMIKGTVKNGENNIEKIEYEKADTTDKTREEILLIKKLKHSVMKKQQMEI